MSNEPLTQADENLLAQADHGRLADLLFELRGALADVERKDAPMQAALKHAVGLVDALQAGLTCNCLLGGWYPLRLT